MRGGWECQPERKEGGELRTKRPSRERLSQMAVFGCVYAYVGKRSWGRDPEPRPWTGEV